MDWGALGTIGAGYALGCMATAYYLVRWRTGQDLRQLHSGNVGARNAGRVLGAPGFLFVTVCDMGKAALACGLARWWGMPEWVVGATLVAVIIGHAFPVQLGFRGGKGVNCIGGGTLVFAPWGVLWFVAALVPGLAARRGITFASGIGFAVSPVVLAWQGASQTPWVAAAAVCVIGLLFRDPLGVARGRVAPLVTKGEIA